MVRPACLNKASRSACVATTVPLPGKDKPNASVKQFIELAVNIPEQDPQVGQAERSTSARSASDTLLSAAMTMASIKSSFLISNVFVSGLAKRTLPASIGPPETKITGMLRRMAAINIPGVILSQLEIQTIASAQCALTIYSTESAIMSRLGNEYNMPS